jgi:hypothetical protein
MENTEFTLPEYSAKPKFSHTPATEQDWKSIGQWAKFFAIYGFVTFGLGIAGLLFTFYNVYQALHANPFILQMLPPQIYLYLAVMLLIVAVAFVCTFMGSRYHLRYAENIKKALERRDQDLLTEAWSNMKSVWKLYGIYFLSVLVAYMLMLILFR